MRTGPARLLDLGCNTGEYSKVAIDAGARFRDRRRFRLRRARLGRRAGPSGLLAGAVPVLGHRESVTRPRVDAGRKNVPGETTRAG